ncbi:hypothetical protein [Neobacillus sp. OS1-33]|uniref:hypothetical protein n=1 Tax=Neobacillus sp. OS1-33 TaxID=3070683 RepID=UPI0027E21406|nr:hypothetical protein [Neobacillus sp. OS1-33]WML25693.1 hypothetical protein RCG22_23210 [Neobacillus sp. OS1-33]
MKYVKNKSDFASRLASFFDHVTEIYTFREGNGRTQRGFFRTLALQNGFKLDWTKADEEEVVVHLQFYPQFDIPFILQKYM